MWKGYVFMLSSKIQGLIVGAFALILLTACGTTDEAVKPNKDQTPSQTDEQVTKEQPQEQEEPEEGTPPTALEAAATVMSILKAGDMNSLSAWAHRKKGIRYSPYAYVDSEEDLVFSKKELSGLMKDSTVYEWRTFPGSGALIELTYADYHKQFVYDVDFIKNAEISLNEVQGEGTTINNLYEVYPKDTYDFVEYHIDGIDPQYEGMDWRSLRLVFEKIGHDHILVGIIHDQWTP